MDDDNGSLNSVESSFEEDDDNNDVVVDDDDDDDDDEAGDLPVPVPATYEVNHGEEELYKLSQTMGMLRTQASYNNYY